MQFSPVSCHFALLSANVFLSTLSLHSSLNITDVTPTQTAAKIMVLHILILIFLDIKQDDKDFGPSGSRNTDNLLLTASCKRCGLSYTERRN